jgi:hypothetical protein
MGFAIIGGKEWLLIFGIWNSADISLCCLENTIKIKLMKAADTDG